MAELAGGAALLVPPGAEGPLAEALGAALDAGPGTDRRALGLRVAAERTWEASVAEHLRAYALAQQAPL
jgi:hypothetical protein